MIGFIIKELRSEKELTQTEVAHAIGYSVSILSDWERDKKQPTAPAVVKLCEYFGVSGDYLLGLSDNDRPAECVSTRKQNSDISEIAALCKKLDKLQLAETKGFIWGLLKSKIR